MSDLILTPNQTAMVDWLKQQRINNVTATPERFAQFKSEFIEQLITKTFD